MDRFGRTWQLFKESFAVLAGDAEILVFPVCSGISLLLLGATFLIPLYRDGTLQAVAHHKGKWDDYAVLFCWYYLNFFVGIFFNSALMGCANIRLSGGQPTVSAGFRMAVSRLGPIALWALVAASVGLVLSTMRDRRNKLLSIMAAGLSLAWSLITYMIVPVLLFEDRGVFSSMHRSEQLFRSHWGEQVAGGFGFGLLTTLLSIPAVLLALGCWRIDPIAGIILAGVYLLILATVTSAVRGVFTVALYRYATAGSAPSGFSADMIDGALGGGRRAAEQAPWDTY
jgi:hypothetical protein